jgi:hypothetical protein
MVRVRHGRMLVAFAALFVTLVALLGGIGVLPTGTSPAAATGGAGKGEQASLSSQEVPAENTSGTPAPLSHSDAAVTQKSTDLPADTGWGKRIIFDISDQRVWLVDGSDKVRRTYLVSGSVTDNLSPGTYAVYSRSRWAVGIDDSGVMQYFVRFTHGANAAIGFHSIPTKDGHPVQARSELGSPQSHGCIRQALPDAIALWNFAPVDTKVVVTA